MGIQQTGRSHGSGGRRLAGPVTSDADASRRIEAQIELGVAERTEELEQLTTFLGKANVQLRQQFMDAVRVLSSTIELAVREESRHAKRVAEIAREIATGLSLPAAGVQNVTIGALLHDLGLIGLDAKLVGMSWAGLRAEEKRQLDRHPLRAHAALLGASGFDEAALAIRHHREWWDGAGVPDALAGDDIPVCARILAVAVDFEHLRLGQVTGRAMAALAAADHIRERAGRQYDPAVVAQLLKVLAESQGLYPEILCEAAIAELQPGMVLGRDIVTENGVPLIARDLPLTAQHVRRLREWAARDDSPPTAYVRCGGQRALVIVLEKLAAIAPPARRPGTGPRKVVAIRP
jgi:HD-GYP domain-containing protein (c-di-GMP phosphodiesterase class II)